MNYTDIFAGQSCAQWCRAELHNAMIAFSYEGFWLLWLALFCAALSLFIFENFEWVREQTFQTEEQVMIAWRFFMALTFLFTLGFVVWNLFFK